MCSHMYESLRPVFDENDRIEAAEGVLCCSLLDDANLVLNGVGEYYANVLDLQSDGWHRLIWVHDTNPTIVAINCDSYDPEIPF